MGLQGKGFDAGGYRYGFNGKENDNEIKGEGNEIDYGMRVYDPRVARFLSVDPLTKQYPHYTPYSYAGNKPIAFIDRDGEEEGIDNTLRRKEEAYLSNQLSEDKYREQVRAMGVGGVIGAAITIDAFVTKGKVTMGLLGLGGETMFWGSFDHKTARTAEGRAEQAQRTKEVAIFMGLGVAGKLVGKAVDGFLPLFNRTLYNFGNNALGEMGESALMRLYGTVKPSGRGSGFRTSQGIRFADGIPAGSTVTNTEKIFEAKVGFQEYSGNIVKQVAKDADLLTSGQVKEITWTFFRSPSTGQMGASDELINQLNAAGIKINIAGDIPKDIVKDAIIKYGPTKK